MPMDTYTLNIEHQGLDIITNNSGFILKVHKLRGHSFRYNKAELQFYAQGPECMLVFETEHWGQKQLQQITAAINWYCGTIGHPALEISIDPKKHGIELI